jgi:hypothetical protein
LRRLLRAVVGLALLGLAHLIVRLAGW